MFRWWITFLFLYLGFSEIKRYRYIIHTLRYVSLSHLEEGVVYKIEQIYVVRHPVTLYIRKYECFWQIKTYLLIPRISRAFQRVREMNRTLNGEAATMYLTYLGDAPDLPTYEWYLLVRISGRNFITYLL
jgi:hypothetical protein